MVSTLARRALGAFALALVLSGPVLAQPQRLSLTEAQAYASDLLDQDQPAAAREIALGLLQADPANIEALILLSRAERMLGNTDAALAAGRAAWKLAQTPPEKFVTASVVAQALSADERYAATQIWLRRAAQAAPTPELRALAARDFGAVRQANPWAIDLKFGISPSNNVNNGNSNATVTFAYLPGPLSSLPWIVPADDRPLSGVQVSGQIEVSYRLTQTPFSKTSISLQTYASGYLMSDESRRVAPAVTGESLSYGQVVLGLSHNWVPEGSRNPYSVDLSLTQSYYALDPYVRDIGLSFARQWTRPSGDQLTAAATVNNSRYLASNFATDGLLLTGVWAHPLDNGDRLTLSLRGNRVFSDRPDTGFTATSASLGYDFGTILPGLDLSMSLQIEDRIYDRSNYDPAGRRDLRSSAAAMARLSNLDLYGFAPEITLRGTSTQSTVPYFDTDALTLGIGLSSSF